MHGKETFDQGSPRIIPDAWTAFPHTFAQRASQGKWIPYRHLRYISLKLLDGIIKGGGRYIVTCPPRHGKSELISNWLPTWYLYNFSDRKVILTSYAVEFATKWGAKVKENLTENPVISLALSQTTKAKKRFMTMDGGQMITAGIGGPITGEGANLFIIDDPLKNYEDAMSELVREKHKEWFDSVARTRLEPNATIIILQTRWHEDDLSGWLMNDERAADVNRKAWTVINLPALCEDPFDPLGRAIGEPLCPERYDAQALLEIKADLTDMIWAALFQQRPAAMQGNIIQREWVKFYDAVPDGIEEKIIFADLTFKEGTNTDFTCVECWGRKGANIYLLDQIRARMGLPAQMEAIEAMHLRHPDAYEKQIEEAANGAALIAMLKDKIMGLIAINPHTSKMARLAAVTPMYQAGNVHYPNPDKFPWVNVNLNEILSFPNAKHDDTVDVATMAVMRLSKVSASIQRLEALGRM